VLGPSDADLFEQSIEPDYLSLFAEPLMRSLLRAPESRVCHLHCRTGVLDAAVFEHMPDAHLYGSDTSLPAIEKAQARAVSREQKTAKYIHTLTARTPFRDRSFSHAFTLHPSAGDYPDTLAELSRLVAPWGQVLVAMPLQGSFAEIGDLLHEYAERHDLDSLASSIACTMQRWPTAAQLSDQLERRGMRHVTIETSTHAIRFESGKDLFKNAALRLLVLPELRQSLELRDDRPFTYVRDAINKYWSDMPFELSLTVGVVSARAPGEAS